MATDSFRDFVLEQLAALEGLRSKRMFGGNGLYSGEVFFGILFDGTAVFQDTSGHLAGLPERLKPPYSPPRKNRF